MDRPGREKIRGILHSNAGRIGDCWNVISSKKFDNIVDQILALVIPDIEEGAYKTNIRVNKILAKVYQRHKIDIEEVKKQERLDVVAVIEEALANASLGNRLGAVEVALEALKEEK